MAGFKIEDTILYEDKDILVCHKPAGIAVQSARMSEMDVESALKNYLALKNNGKPPYLGIIHRLDQPVEGVLVFALTPRAAKELNRQMAAGMIEKEYLAVTECTPSCKEGKLEDYLKKDGRTNTSSVAALGTAGAKKASLHYWVLEELEVNSGEREKMRYLIKIRLETGRHHQIRVQMANAGMSLLGDRKYNERAAAGFPLALCAWQLKFQHPVSKKKMCFRALVKNEAFRGFSFMNGKE